LKGFKNCVYSWLVNLIISKPMSCLLFAAISLLVIQSCLFFKLNILKNRLNLITSPAIYRVFFFKVMHRHMETIYYKHAITSKRTYIVSLMFHGIIIISTIYNNPWSMFLFVIPFLYFLTADQEMQYWHSISGTEFHDRPNNKKFSNSLKLAMCEKEIYLFCYMYPINSKFKSSVGL
jgi:hypothetical protein